MSQTSETPRIGVFICHCGTNIGGFLNMEDIENYIKTVPNVVFVTRNLYTCSEGGLREIKSAIKEQNLNRVIVASCTPRTHEPLFRSACVEAGLNPFLFEFVNIRDQCSWVHQKEKEKATEKAKDLIRMGVARAANLEPREEIEIEVTKTALVMGGGVAGLTAAIALADRGYPVKLVERTDKLGGLVKGLNTLYPTMTQASRLIQDLVDRAAKHPNMQVLLSSEVVLVKGFVGNYKVTVKTPTGEEEFTIGSIVVAIGTEVFKPEGMFGYDGKNVITQYELEPLLGKGPIKKKSIVMIQCAGARIPGREYCSRVCCMTAIKNAILIKESEPGTEIFILNRDLQTYGTLYEDFFLKARELGVVFLRYDLNNMPEVKMDQGVVEVYNEVLNRVIQLPADMVVLATPLVAGETAPVVNQLLKVPLDKDRFFLEAHVKLRPADFATEGVYICGSARWPSDIPESISQALAAASRASIPLAKGKIQVEPIVSQVNQELCIGCGLCADICPYSAIQLNKTEVGFKAESIPASCKGCGLCGASCPQNAITMNHFTNKQIGAQIAALRR